MNKLDQIEFICEKYDIDILAVSEHHVTNDNIKLINIAQYSVISYFCRNKFKNGGVAIYSKSQLNCKRIDLDLLSVEGHIELCGITASVNDIKLGIVTVYRPPSGDVIMFSEILSQALTVVSSVSNQIVLCGDLNIDISKNCMNTKLLKDLLESFNLNVTTTEPTRVCIDKNNKRTSSSIDYMATNLEQSRYHSEVINPNLADHFAHLFSIKLVEKYRLDKISYKSRNMSTDNLNRFGQLVAQTDWSPLYELSINNAFIYFIDSLSWCLDSSCPLKVINKPVGGRNNAWISDDIIRQSEYLKNLFWLMNNLQNPELKNIYDTEKRNYRSNISRAKRDYYANTINSASNKPKATWNIINSKLGKKNKQHNFILHVNGDIVSDKSSISAIFLESFSKGMPTKVVNHFSYNLSLPPTASPCILNSIFIQPTDTTEVAEVLNSIKNKHSAGYDGLSAELLIFVRDFTIDHLVNLINRSIAEGYFPDALKLSIVIPVYKKGDVHEIDNYRPISLLNSTSKVIEKIISRRVMDFISKHNILTVSQHGFLPKKSVETASCHYLSYIYDQLDSGRYVISMLFDLSKAFDSVDFSILITKLEAIGIRGIALQLISSYMRARKLQVKVEDAKSEIGVVNLGVPQGSVLGPLLFLLYVNDLPKNISCGHVTMFADDTSITVSGSDPSELLNNIRIVSDEFSAWCQRNRLILNEGKTVIINYSIQKHLPEDFSSKNNLELVWSTKLLGTIFDSRLSFAEHADHVCSQLNRAFYAILQLKSLLGQGELLTIYYSLAYSYLSYNVMVWGSSKHSARVFLSQKRILRLIFNKRQWESCRPIFKQHKILTLTCIYILKCVCFVKLYPNDFCSLNRTKNYATRNTNLLLMQNHNTAFFEKSPHYNCVALYNKLPLDVRTIDSYDRFKKKVKFLLSDYGFYNVSEYMSVIW
nr:unnamed protein product [Callosobruchus analis]